MVFSIRIQHVQGILAPLALAGMASSAMGAGTQTQSVIGNTVTPSAMIGLGNIAGVASNAASGGGGFFSGNTARFGLPGQGQGTGAAAAAGRNVWNGWVAYSQNRVGYSFEPLQSSGTVNLGMVGVDYTLANNMVVGVALAGDRTDITMNGSALTGSLKGSGYTISPYIGMPLGKAWVLDATVGFGRTKIDTVQFGSTGSFRTDRTLGSVGLSYRQAVGKWQLTGRGAVLAVEDRLGAYTLSNGTFNADGKVSLSQLRLSGQAGYNMGQVVPYVGLSYIYDIRRPDQAPVAGQSAANDRDAWAPSIGIRFSSGGALYGGLQYTSEKSRSQVKNNQILFNLGLRF
jgi:Autotransporter beta-domain